MQRPLKNYAFIDSQNLNLGIKAAGWSLDFKRFRIYLRDKFGVEQAYLFIGFVHGNRSLYTYLQQAGYIVIWKPTLEFVRDGQTHIKGNVDGELILHAMIEYPHYEKAIIVSGDGDFNCLLEYFVEKDKLARLLVTNHDRFSSLLRKYRNHTVFLDGPGMQNKLQKHKERE
mgnify:CR=1 FL=1